MRLGRLAMQLDACCLPYSPPYVKLTLSGLSDAPMQNWLRFTLDKLMNFEYVHLYNLAEERQIEAVEGG